MCKFADHKNHVRWIYLTTVLCMGEGQKYATMSNFFPKKSGSASILQKKKMTRVI